jgi:cytochrome c
MMGPNPSILRKSVLQAAVFYATIVCQPDASQAQNLAEDRKLFETTCTPCHNYDKGGEPDMYGLTLNLSGIVGRKAASVAGFRYSEDLRKSGIVWDEAIIDRFIAAPKKLLPGTRMELPGVEDVKTRTGIIRYLRSLAQ